MTGRTPIWFNASYVAGSPALNDVVERAVRRLPRKRDHPKVRRQVEALLCNCVAAAVWGDGSFQIPMNSNSYKRANPYCHPGVEKSTLPGLVRELASVHCLELVEAGSHATASVSRYGPYADFKRAIQECGPSDLGMDHEGPAVYLREKGERDWSRPADDRKVTNKWFNLSDYDIRSLADEVHDYNRWTETFGFSIGGFETNSWEGRYYRLFSNNFLEHGRLYGHPIVTFPKESRWLLKMGGESLVELDITASLATIAYANQGDFSLPVTPYIIPAVEEAYRECGWPADDVERIARKCVKKVVVQRLCDKGARKGYWLDVPGEEAFPWPRAVLNCPALIGLVCDHLPGLASYIRAERTEPPAGLRLMRKEADIMLSAVKALRQRELMALLVHDAVFVRRCDYETAGLVLARAFHSATGLWPVIKATDFRSPEEAAYQERNGLKMAVEWLRSKSGKTPAWPRRLEGKLLSNRKQYQRSRDIIIQALARRLVAAWKHYKRDYLRTDTDPLPHSFLNSVLRAAAITHRELEMAGAEGAGAEAKITNGLRKAVIEDAGSLAWAMATAGSATAEIGGVSEEATGWQGRALFHEALVKAGFPGPWDRDSSGKPLEGNSGDGRIYRSIRTGK